MPVPDILLVQTQINRLLCFYFHCQYVYMHVYTCLNMGLIPQDEWKYVEQAPAVCEREEEKLENMGWEGKGRWRKGKKKKPWQDGTGGDTEVHLFHALKSRDVSAHSMSNYFFFLTLDTVVLTHSGLYFGQVRESCHDVLFPATLLCVGFLSHIIIAIYIFLYTFCWINSMNIFI